MAAGYGMPAVYTLAGVGTRGCPEGKEVRNFDGKDYLLEYAFDADFCNAKAWKGGYCRNLFSTLYLGNLIRNGYGWQNNNC